MRVSRLDLRRVRTDDGGAVLMITALCLLVLLGMLVLTVDLGRGVAFKRQLVNGADAASIAAAQECALEHGSGAAQTAALSTLGANVDGNLGAGLRSISMPGCDGGNGTRTVTVVGEGNLEYFFAGIFGFESGDVAARAVAMYGPVPEANPVPITVDNAQLLSCGIVAGDPPANQVDCDLDYPKDALQEPRWGVLDLSQWGDPDAAPCHVTASELQGVIAEGGWSVPLKAPAPDCLDNGLSFSVWASMEGKVLTFPVIDITRSTGTVKPGGGSEPCTGADIPTLQAQGKDCQIDTAFVIGFISLLVNSVVNSGSTVMVDTTYLGPTIGGGTPCVPGVECPADYGIRAVRLVE